MIQYLTETTLDGLARKVNELAGVSRGGAEWYPAGNVVVDTDNNGTQYIQAMATLEPARVGPIIKLEPGEPRKRAGMSPKWAKPYAANIVTIAKASARLAVLDAMKPSDKGAVHAEEAVDLARAIKDAENNIAQILCQPGAIG